jgi:hypothetical protein
LGFCHKIANKPCEVVLETNPTVLVVGNKDQLVKNQETFQEGKVIKL